MYRIRFHGRGGQGIKTASRIFGTAFFLEGYEVQDAPRYGAERRGAPMFAYVRVSRSTIYERGVVHAPDLVVVADASLQAMPVAGVYDGCTSQTVLLVDASPAFHGVGGDAAFAGSLVTLDADRERDAGVPKAYGSSLWAGAAARLCGVISEENLWRAVQEELRELGEGALKQNISMALSGWDAMIQHAGIVRESMRNPPIPADSPLWMECSVDPVSMAAPAIRLTGTSRNVKTGLWRTERPVIDHAKCGRCWWNCSVYCPDSAISLNEEGYPVIDYEYCKGCLVCARQCPRKAIEVLPEGVASDPEKGGRP